MVCADPCLYYNYAFSVFEMIAHQLLPAAIIIVSSITLLMRAVRQKYRAHQPIQWRKHRKMTIQVLVISVVYLALFFPYALYNLLLTCGVSSRKIRDLEDYSEVFAYTLTLLLPFICVISLPELKLTVNKIFNLRRTRTRVFPVTITSKSIPKQPKPIQ